MPASTRWPRACSASNGEAGASVDGDGGHVAVDSVPAALLAEVDAAVADLIEGSPRRPARRRRRRS
jgi:hypothetical protein